MAMSLALVQLNHPEFEIEHPEVVSKSFPEFWQTLESLGFQYKLTE
jgi:3-phosphoshikimate 1-carboxyvinyltransferase